MTVSDNVRRKRSSLKDLWEAVCVMLKDFKYWLVEGSLHEPLKPPKEFHEIDGDSSPNMKHHRTFKGVQISSFCCDKCTKLARSFKYQCTDCGQGYCTNCWPRTQKHGAHLDDTGEQRFDPKQLSIHIGNPDRPHSATSSSNISPTQTPTEDVPLRHVGEDGFFLLSNISPSLS